MTKDNKILGIGAESIINLINKNTVQKDRIKKTYRLKVLDEKLRKLRTRSETKILQKLQNANVNVPKVISSSDETMTIQMDFIEGEKLRDCLNTNNYKKISKQLGNIIAKIHNLDIIHSDLTTSNMILNKKENKIYLIDFGLSFFSNRTEDKAVDLHLLKQALESYHYLFSNNAFKEILTQYKKTILDKQVISRLAIVEKRGKNKH